MSVGSGGDSGGLIVRRQAPFVVRSEEFVEDGAGPKGCGLVSWLRRDPGLWGRDSRRRSWPAVGVGRPGSFTEYFELRFEITHRSA